MPVTTTCWPNYMPGWCDTEQCLRCQKKAKEEGCHNLANVYKDQEFSHLRQDPRMAEIAPPPTAK